jgi:hypothetical protein
MGIAMVMVVVIQAIATSLSEGIAMLFPFFFQY